MRGKFTKLAAGLLFVFGAVILLQQCKHEPILKKNGTPGDTTNQTPEDTTICFERDILPLFVTNCAKSGCHDAITHEEGLRLYTYDGIKAKGIIPGDAANSKILKEINSGKMNSTSGGSPYGNLTTDQVKLITRWVNEGALDGTNCPSKCDTTKFTYNLSIKPMMTKYCNGCHNTSSANGGVILDTHAGVKAQVTANRLLGSLEGLSGFSFMPKGGKKLSDCEITIIKKWINAGALDN